nr:MAG TPA: hypothetical protein [Caudoviricetes sp.]
MKSVVSSENGQLLRLFWKKNCQQANKQNS